MGIAASNSQVGIEMVGLTAVNQTGSVSMNALVRLRTAILDGVYAPNEKLRFADLQSDYGAGVGTLREALSHLLSEGFVTLDAGKGFHVAPVSLDDLHDITENRVELEKRAIRGAIEHGDDHWEAALVARYHLLAKIEKIPIADRLNDPTAWTNIHRNFHQELVRPCRSKWLLNFHRILFDQAHRYRMLALQHRPRGQSTRTGEHLALMDAMLRRDPDRAISLAEQHIRRTTEDVERHSLLIQLGSRPR